ncbi:MAG: leucyl aminopeptidase [Candidatus Jidaibacter sp.]|jgi:leucyl aminopeptidase|nr:leucyl aminopeptidase [Candidatus Jidaibacter sp.]
MDFSFIDAKKIGGNIGVFFITDTLKFSQDFCKHNYEADVSKILKSKKNFRAKVGQILSFIPSGESEFSEIILVGLGKRESLDTNSIKLVGSKLVQHLNNVEAEEACICFNLNIKLPHAQFVNNFYLGMALRNYKFTKYFVDKATDNKIHLKKVSFCMEDASVAKQLLAESKLLVSSVNFTRDLVSEPANVLYPKSFADACKKLEKSGLKVRVMAQKELAKLGMGALLGVAQGSVNEPYVVIMEWNGGNKKDAPIAFLGKGVTFDTGGISIKPSQNMGDMKYDMAGAGVVTGLMKTLAERKAKVNAVGVIGLVENMPSGTAQRPGDVVKSMSGQTIEIDNTDAEGRLVLADILWYTQGKYKPKFMVNLATLTGAIVIALGENAYAGLFSNDDKLASELNESGLKSGDKVWRFPLSDFYDKQINSEIADVRNTGNGRGAGSITAAQFLKRFVNNVPWAHLDIAGMAWDKSGAELNPKGATGYGVQILNQLVKDYYEAK